MTNSNYLINSYQRLNIEFSYGNGVWLYDNNKQKYFDAITGIGVNALGHNHPEIIKTIQTQCQKLIHTSNLYHISGQKKLAQKLCEMSQMEGVFFTNSGTEASECALKISRLFGRKKNYFEPKIIVFTGGFHGRSFGALSASSNAKIQAGFSPLLRGFLTAKFNDLSSVEALFQTESEIVAVFIEPIQGEGGIKIADFTFLKGLRKLCDSNDALLMFDEVQSGLGRTGQWFAAHHQQGLMADVVTLAKPLGAGVPIGACLVGKRANLISPGKHGTTFGGNPLCTAVALTFLEVMEKNNLIKNIQEQSTQLIKGIKNIFNSEVYQVRAKGLMIGIEVELKNDFLKQAVLTLPSKALEVGLLINVTSGNVIRLLPPFIINSDEVELLLDKLQTLKEKFLV